MKKKKTKTKRSLNCHQSSQEGQSTQFRIFDDRYQCTGQPINNKKKHNNKDNVSMVSFDVGVVCFFINVVAHTRTTPIAFSGLEIKTTTPISILTGVTPLTDILSKDCSMLVSSV